MENDQNTIVKLLQSKSKSSKYLGLAILATIFFPQVLRAIDNPNLSTLQRLEQVFVAAGQTMLTIGAVGVRPEDVIGESKDKADQPGKLTKTSQE